MSKIKFFPFGSSSRSLPQEKICRCCIPWFRYLPVKPSNFTSFSIQLPCGSRAKYLKNHWRGKAIPDSHRFAKGSLVRPNLTQLQYRHPNVGPRPVKFTILSGILKWTTNMEALFTMFKIVNWHEILMMKSTLFMPRQPLYFIHNPKWGNYSFKFEFSFHFAIFPYVSL